MEYQRKTRSEDEIDEGRWVKLPFGPGDTIMWRAPEWQLHTAVIKSITIYNDHYTLSVHDKWNGDTFISTVDFSGFYHPNEVPKEVQEK